MGLGQNLWREEELACSDNVVLNVAHSARLEEECDVLFYASPAWRRKW